MKNKIEMYCITHKRVSFLEGLNYVLVNVGADNISKKYLNCDTGNNIIKKEKYYSELTFHYWFWKNKLDINSFRHHINTFNWGMPPHSGWGFGLDRFLMIITGTNNIREVVLFPRDPNRLTP